jgi:hypothetical protein
MIQRVGIVVASLVIGAAAMLGAFSFGQALAAPITVPAFVSPGDALTVAPAAAPRAALPDPADAPAEAASLVYELYKAGHLIPGIVVAGFFLLTLLQRWIAWLRVGWRKLAVACALAGLGMLAERAASGVTPSLPMLLGAFGVAFAMWIKGEGEPKPEAAK